MPSPNPFAGVIPADTPGAYPDSPSLTVPSLTPTPEANDRREQLARARREVPGKVEEKLLILNDRDIPVPQRLESVAEAMTVIIPLILAEGLAAAPDPERSVALSRTMAGMKDVISVLKAKREIETSDEVNPHSPKFGLVIGWFLDLVHGVMVDQGVDALLIANIFARISTELQGWEDRVEKRLRGVSGRALESLDSPFMTDFKAGLREQSRKKG